MFVFAYGYVDGLYCVCAHVSVRFSFCLSSLSCNTLLISSQTTRSGKILHFKGSSFHRVIPGFMCQVYKLTVQWLVIFEPFPFCLHINLILTLLTLRVATLLEEMGEVSRYICVWAVDTSAQNKLTDLNYCDQTMHRRWINIRRKVCRRELHCESFISSVNTIHYMICLQI